MARPSQLLLVAAVLAAAALLVTTVPLAANAAASTFIDCRQMENLLSPCVGYATGKAPAVPTDCCNGLKCVKDVARTTADRQAICDCVKRQMSGVVGLRPGLAAAIPGKCGVDVAQPIGPSTDCSKIK